MTSQELGSYVRIGVRQRLAELQTVLAQLFAEFPSEFSVSKAPVFFSANGYASIAPPPPPKKRRRRRTRQAAPAAVKTAKKSTKKTPKRRTSKAAWGTRLWQRAHDVLAKRPDNTGTLHDIVTATKAKTPASAIGAMLNHPEVFKRSAPGQYTLVTVLTHD